MRVESATRDELRVRLEGLNRELQSLDGAFQSRSMPEKAKSKWNRLVEERDEAQSTLEELETRAKYLKDVSFEDVYNEETRITDVDSQGNRSQPLVKSMFNRALMGDKSVERSQGLRAIEELQRDGMSSTAADRLDTLFRSEGSSKDALYLRSVSTPAYARAYMKRMNDPDNARHSFTDEEASAMRTAMECSRAIGLGSQGGQYPVPASLDPSINLVSDGRTNPIRALARTVTISTDRWVGVNSIGATATFYAEFGTVSDDSPVLTQPTITPARISAFCPVSFELFDDWRNATDEISRVFADAFDDEEAEKFALGTGTNEPYGLLKAGGTVTQGGTADAAIVQNLYNLQQAVGSRYIGNSSWLSSNVFWNRAYRAVAEADTTEPEFVAPDRQSAIGYPWNNLSHAATAFAGTVCAFGDFNRGYTIVDRICATTEVIQNLLDPVSGRPYGARGLFHWGRVGGSVTDANAYRRLVTS